MSTQQAQPSKHSVHLLITTISALHQEPDLDQSSSKAGQQAGLVNTVNCNHTRGSP
jgi:hypothetical protein